MEIRGSVSCTLHPCCGFFSRHGSMCLSCFLHERVEIHFRIRTHCKALFLYCKFKTLWALHSMCHFNFFFLSFVWVQYLYFLFCFGKSLSGILSPGGFVESSFTFLDLAGLDHHFPTVGGTRESGTDTLWLPAARPVASASDPGLAHQSLSCHHPSRNACFLRSGLDLDLGLAQCFLSVTVQFRWLKGVAILALSWNTCFVWNLCKLIFSFKKKLPGIRVSGLASLPLPIQHLYLPPHPFNFHLNGHEFLFIYSLIPMYLP